MKLQDRVAIVTGAAQGIGKAVATKLAGEGAKVVAVDLTLSRHGKVDVLANVAAIVPFTAWDEITFEEWRRIMSVNLDGVFLTIKAVEKPMRDAGYGRIVNVAS